MLGQAESAVKRLRDNLDRSLFLPRPAQTANFGVWEAGVLLVSFVALAAVLQLFRLGPSSTLNSLWAEDGTVFLGGTLTHGFFDAVTTPYAGYLVVVPRLIGEVGAAVPLHDAAAAMNLAAVLVIAISGLAVWFASAGHIHSPYLRGLLVALMVLSPVSTIEAVASTANVAWYMTFAVFWLLLWQPTTTWGACLGGLFVLATFLSTPATLFLTPIALLRAIAIRGLGDVMLWRAGDHTSFGGRYTITPVLLLVSAALALLDAHYRTSRGRRPIAAFGVAAILLVSLVTSFDARETTGRGGSPWDKSLDAATARCEANGSAEVQTSISPEGWTMTVPCDRLTSTAGGTASPPGS